MLRKTIAALALVYAVPVSAQQYGGPVGPQAVPTKLTGDVTSVGNAATLANIPAIAGTNLTGTAVSLTAGNATKLTTGRTIAITGGVSYISPSFDGSGNVTAAATVNTNANLTGPITSVGNATAVAAQTGTGSTFVMSVSPVLTTPTIGAATATSATYPTGTPGSGAAATGNTMSNYEEGTCTLTDASGASLTLTSELCLYTVIGRMVFVTYAVLYPTTADASNTLIAGLPYVTKNTAIQAMNGTGISFSSYTLGPVQVYTIPNTLNFALRTNGQTSLTNVAVTGKEFRGGITYIR